MARRRDIILDLPPDAAAAVLRWRQAIESKTSARVPPPLSQTTPKPPPPKGIAALRELGWRILPLPGLVGSGPTARLHRTSNGWVGTNGWVVIPPDARTNLLPQRFDGRNRAIRWAYEQATSGSAPA